MENKYEELIKACQEGHLYDFIANEAYRFTKEELIQILKNLDYSIYLRLGDQIVEVERILPESLYDDYFFDDLTADEIAYFRYLAGSYSYQEYINVCEQEDVKQPKPRK